MRAAKQEADVFPLAAFRLLAENSHRGHRLPTAVPHKGFAPVNSNTTTGFQAFLYDEGRRSRSTGKERDSETGLDYFGARYFSGAQGRFTSPDWAATPEAVPYATLADPQTLNLYGYVRNNPLKSTDPTGHCPICLAEEFFASPEGQAITEEGSALLQKAVAVGLVLGAATLDNARPPSYVPGGSLTDEKGNSIFSSNVRSENSNSDQSSNQPQSSLVGNNPREAKGRVNTDLPGGHDEAKATFGKQTEGQQVKPDSATGHQVSEDGTRLRLNPDGTARVDIPASATRPKHETVHFNPPQKNTPGQP